MLGLIFKITDRHKNMSRMTGSISRIYFQISGVSIVPLQRKHTFLYIFFLYIFFILLKHLYYTSFQLVPWSLTHLLNHRLTVNSELKINQLLPTTILKKIQADHYYKLRVPGSPMSFTTFRWISKIVNHFYLRSI